MLRCPLGARSLDIVTRRERGPLTISERLPPKRNAFFPEAVVFDLDGLMIDTERLDWQASKAVGAARGIDVDDDFLRQTIGRRLVDIEPEFERRFGHVVRWRAFAREIQSWREDYIARYGMPWKTGVAELLDHLDQRGIPRALATSTVREEAMARMGPLFTRMHTAAFGGDVANGKPAPDIYLLAVERLGVPADRCLALEDSLPGVEAAERAGVTVIMVPDLVPSHDGIRYVCGSLLGVRDWLAA
jgi:HAD superfamily hydrolase (TIGR01509 family)